MARPATFRCTISAENTDRDVKHALRELASKGMRRLLFDIRGNPGAPARSGDQSVERISAARQMIVYTRGRIANSDQDYRATEDSEFTTFRSCCSRIVTARAHRKS